MTPTASCKNGAYAPSSISRAQSWVTHSHGVSYDPESDPVSYEWLQVAGPAVTLSPSNQRVNPNFMAPTGAVGQTLIFKLIRISGSDQANTLIL